MTGHFQFQQGKASPLPTESLQGSATQLGQSPDRSQRFRSPHDRKFRLISACPDITRGLISSDD